MAASGTTRTPQQIFADHSARLGTGDLDHVVENYAEDANFVTPHGVLRGRDGVKQGLAKLLADLPDATWQLNPVFAGDVMLLPWTANGPTGRVVDGVDTFVFRDGEIAAQTIRYTLQPTQH